LEYHLSFKKKISRNGGNLLIWGIWNVEVYGPNISVGKNVVIIGANGSRTRITTVKFGSYEGSIDIGDNVLVMNSVRISSASKIVIGEDCMLASNCYLTDADWHDIHDRTKLIGDTAPIILEKGVWVGDSAIICKGVHIGENSVVGAGSVVRRNVPPNVVVAGNPAKVVKRLDPKKVITMSALYKKYGWLSR
jgi:acetyltransferase-like isoleucine patch superfamily enzyme